jgi:hypothetical protein
VLRDQVLAVAGDPADFGGLEPDADILRAGLAQSQHYLPYVTEGRIVVRPGVARIDGSTVVYDDGRRDEIDVVVLATGYDIDLPYLSDEVRRVANVDDSHADLYHRTFHPALPGLAFVGQFVLVGPYFPVLELQARWVSLVWSGAATLPSPDAMHAAIARFRVEKHIAPHDLHHALAGLLASEIGVAPELAARPDLVRDLVFGPLVAARYLLDGPGAHPKADALFRDALASLGSPRVDAAPEQIEALAAFADALGDDDLRDAVAILRRS